MDGQSYNIAVSNQQTCASCGCTTPRTDTNHTLIGNHGWRLVRVDRPGSTTMREWYCPDCWKKHKAQSGIQAPLVTRVNDGAEERATGTFRQATEMLSRLSEKVRGSR